MGFHANREEISAKCPHRSDGEVICSMSCINPPILWTDHPWLNFHNLKRENVTLSHGGDTNSGKDSITLIMVVSQAVDAQHWVCIWRTKFYKIYLSNFRKNFHLLRSCVSAREFFCRPAADLILMPPTFPIASLNRYTQNFSGRAYIIDLVSTVWPPDIPKVRWCRYFSPRNGCF